MSLSGAGIDTNIPILWDPLLNRNRKPNKGEVAKQKEFTNKDRKILKTNESRTLKPACTCKRKCYEKLTEVDRLIIFDDFWKNHCSSKEKRQYIADRIAKIKRTNEKDMRRRRNYTLRYTLRVQDINIQVCQVMFLNTLSIDEWFMRYTINKKIKVDGGVEPDRRGKYERKKTPAAMYQLVKDYIATYINLVTRNNNQKRRNSKVYVKDIYRHYKEHIEKEGNSDRQHAKLWLFRQVYKSEFQS